MADGQAPDATVLAILVLQHQAVLALAQADVLPLHHLHLVRRGLAQRLSVEPQFGRAAVAEGLDGGDGLRALHGALAYEVDKAVLRVPVGLVEVEGILPDLAVVGDQALIIAAHVVALAAAGHGEVEHVPDERAPQVGTRLQLAPVLDVVVGLPVLRMPGAEGLGLLQAVGLLEDAAARAILADAYLALGMGGVLAVQPLAHLVDIVAIPAEVFVEVHPVGEAVEVGIDGAGAHGGTRGVEPVGQVVQPGHHVRRIILPQGADLVVEAPHQDTGMVIVLQDEFRELLLQVLPVGGTVHIDIDKGNLGPGHEAAAVHLVVHVLVLRIVGQAHGIGAHLLNEVQVLVVVAGLKGRQTLGTVLVAADAVQAVGTAVEEEAPVRIGLVVAEAYLLLATVHLAPRPTQDDDGPVEVRVADTVPQVGTLHEGLGHGTPLACKGGDGGRMNLPAVIPQLKLHLAAVQRRLLGGQQGLHPEAGTLLAHLALGKEHARRGIIVRRDAHVVVRHQQLHAAIQAARQVEVAVDGGHIHALGVADHNLKAVLLSGLQVVRQLGHEGGIAAPVLRDETAVDKDIGHGLRGLHPQEYPPACPRGGHRQRTAVDAHAPVIVRTGKHHVALVPRMGQVDSQFLANGLITTMEFPAPVQRDDLDGTERLHGPHAQAEEEKQILVFHILKCFKMYFHLSGRINPY